MKRIDCHVHVSPEISPDALVCFLDRTQTDGAVLQAVWHSRLGSLAPLAMQLKKQFPGRFFVFGAPDASLYHSAASAIGKAQLAYLEPLLDSGMDGVKLLEGKPYMRKVHPIPAFDAECWEPFWDYMEQNAVPITFHVNDPETFWSNVPDPWLVKQGWQYDASYINNEEQYAEIERVLNRHPKLKLILAHFYFMSGQLTRLSALLDAYKNIAVDLTPGIEMYENFSGQPDKAAAFFARYHDRICYGTDIGGRCILTNEGYPFNERENLRRPQIVRAFLEDAFETRIESDGEYLVNRKPFVLKPLGLTEERLTEIYSRNILQMLCK